MKIKNRIITTVASVVLLFGMSLTAAFAAGNVSYEGQAQGFVFKPGSSQSVTDLFTNFKVMMPGDEATDSVEVKNNSGKTVNIYMKALGAESGSEAFLNQMKLTVNQGSSEVFNSTADDKMTDWFLLGSFGAGDSALLDVMLSIPIEMGDEYQNAIGALNWSFKVEEAEEPGTPDTPSEPSDPDTPTRTGSPGTGDTTSLLLIIIVIIGAGMGVYVIGEKRIK